jgi:peptide deformylase
MTDIVQEPSPVLRQVAAPLSITEIKSARIKKILDDMKTALAGQDDGVAIAAPQIGHSLRIFVVAQRASKQLTEDTVFINPEIIRIGKRKKNSQKVVCRYDGNMGS